MINYNGSLNKKSVFVLVREDCKVKNVSNIKLKNRMMTSE